MAYYTTTAAAPMMYGGGYPSSYYYGGAAPTIIGASSTNPTTTVVRSATLGAQPVPVLSSASFPQQQQQSYFYGGQGQNFQGQGFQGQGFQQQAFSPYAASSYYGGQGQQSFGGQGQQSFGGGYRGFGGPSSYGGPGGYGSSYGHPGQNVQAPRGQGYNRGYFYDDYIHDKHSPRRSYAGFRDARVPEYDGDIIYRRPIERDEDFVLPRRSPRSEAAHAAAQASIPAANTATADSGTRTFNPPAPLGPCSIEVMEAKDLPTSILDKTDPYVLVKIGGKEFRTKHKDDAGKSARWNETFTLEGVRSGTEGTIEVRDKDTLKDDAIATASFFLENGDRWYSLKPKGQVRLNVKGLAN